MSGEETQVEPSLRERPVQDEVWRAKAISLAQRAALPVSEIGIVCRFRVPSASKPGEEYTVEMHVETGDWYCTCAANTYGRPCRHVGSVLEHLERTRNANRSGSECHMCDGLGQRYGVTCATCDGSGWLWQPE